MQTIYRPGQWHLLVIPGALVVLPADVPGDVVARLWERLPGEKSLATVIDVLTSRFGGSFSALPPFAAAVAEGDDVRIALRGGVAARVSSSDADAIELSGAEVTTWSERFIGRATRVEITVEPAEGVAELPVQAGVVLVSAVSAELEPGDAEPLVALGPIPVIEASPNTAAPAAAGQAIPALALFGAALPPASLPGPSVASEPSAAPGAPAVDDLISAVPSAESDVEAVSDEEPAAEAAIDVPDESAPAEADGAEATEADTDGTDAAVAETDADAVDAGADAPGEAGPESGATDSDVPESDVPAFEETVSDEAGAEGPAVDPLDLPDEGITLVPTEMTLGSLSDTDEFDQLFGATVHSPSAFDAPPAVGVGEGDHDGATISAAELRSLRQSPPVESEAPTQVIPVAAAGAGRIRLSTGQVVTLDRTVIIGRRPRSTRASGENLPHLVAVESPQQDISRSHLEVRPEGDTVVVIDLHTTNGSTLLRPGADPVRLHPGEQTLVLSGDVVDLGDGVTLAFEDLP
ncbi:MAG: FHA domain-containing protein [Microbacterium sp.]|nr:FHA domain-containing protein [Microbacterium sp.]